MMLLLVVFLFIGGWWCGAITTTKVWELKWSQRDAADVKAIARREQAEREDSQRRQREVAALDVKHTRELNNAKSENDDFRRRVALGGRVHVKGKCKPADKPAASGRMGNDATVELSATAGQNFLDIREGITSDQAKIKYLQDYIRASQYEGDTPEPPESLPIEFTNERATHL
ncbi:lysis protein [Erwinia pyrifoliae]|uniref:lysis protein n=1 Tax=Erwinia pyrifoliae TaxID=79967 RepID=UPI0022B23121|nr:lysis protein [Erwinia pyrifoliae]